MMDSENNMVMPVAPMYGGGYGNNGGFGGFGGDWGWIVLLLLLAGNGGWGGFGGGFGGFGNMALGYDFPWILNGQNGINSNTNAGFDHAATQAALGDINTAVNTGFGNVATQLCGGFAGVNANIANGFAQSEIAENSRQMANMNQMFGIQSALQNCCCENRANIADLKYTVATENCADRAAVSDGIRDILAATQAQTQTILTQMCNDKLEAKNDLISQLRTQLSMADLRASQTAQTAELRQSGATQLNQLVSELRSCPIPAQPVYGNRPIFQCAGPAWNNNGCGCGNGFAN